jgi:hypothetical protein
MKISKRALLGHGTMAITRNTIYALFGLGGGFYFNTSYAMECFPKHAFPVASQD